MKRVLVLTACLACSQTALAQLQSIPPFLGTDVERFEGVPVSGLPCLSQRAFGNRADICTPNGNYCYVGNGYGSWCNTNPHGGAQFFQGYDGRVEVSLDSVTVRFGGWFNSNQSVARSFDFYDSVDALIASVQVVVPGDCQWHWLGWDSAGGAAIKRIMIGTSLPFGPEFMLDDLQADIVDPFPVVYCTSGTTSGACIASLTCTANPDVSGASTCQLSVASVEGTASGLLFYGLMSLVQPWCPSGGGTSFLCVKPPFMRTGIQSAGGSVGQCDGAFALDWGAFQLAHPNSIGAPWLVGDKAFVQAWFRDPPSCRSTSLSNAVELTYQP